MRAAYATRYTTDHYCGAYVRGVLVLVRRRDGHVLRLTLAETNQFVRDLDDAEFSDDDRDPVDIVCKSIPSLRFQKNKYVVTSQHGTVIEFHNEPIKV